MTRKRLRWAVRVSAVLIATALLVPLWYHWFGPRYSSDGLRLPAGAVARIGGGRFRTGEQTYPAGVTADGQRLVVGRVVLDTATGVEVGGIPHVLPDLGSVVQVSLSADGNTAGLLTAGWEGDKPRHTLTVWDVATAAVVRSVPLPASTAFFRTCAVAPGGAAVLIQQDRGEQKPNGGWVSIGELELWTDLATAPKPVSLGRRASGAYTPPAFTADGRRVVDVGPKVRVWDASTGQLVREFEGPAGQTVRRAVSPDGTLVAILSGLFADANPAGDDLPFRVSLWDVDTGKRVGDLGQPLSRRALNSAALSLHFVDGGRTVLLVDDDAEAKTFTARRWLTDGTPHPGVVVPWEAAHNRQAVVSPDGTRLYLVGGRRVRTFDLTSGEETSPAEVRTEGETLVGLTAGDRQIVTRRGTERLAHWELGTGKLLREEPLAGLPTTGKNPRYTPDGRRVLVDLPGAGPNQTDTAVFEAISGRQLHRTPDEPDGTFTTDGRHFWTHTYSGVIRLREVETGKLVREFPRMEYGRFAPSPTGLGVGVWSQWGGAVFDGEAGAVLFDATPVLVKHITPMPLKSHYPGSEKAIEDRIRAAAVGPEGKRFAVVSTRLWGWQWGRPATDRVLVFDSAGKALAWEADLGPDRSEMYAPHALAFSPDGRRLAVGRTGGVTLFDADSGKKLRRFEGHTGTVGEVRFTADGHRLVAADGDGTVWVWDATAR
jgi:WD40 repeat protein